MDFDSGKSSSLHCWTRGTTGCMDIDVSKDDDVCFFNKDEGAAGKLRLMAEYVLKKYLQMYKFTFFTFYKFHPFCFVVAPLVNPFIFYICSVLYTPL